MYKKCLNLIALVLLSLTIIQCGGNTSKKPEKAEKHHSEGAHDHHKAENTVRLAKKQMAKVDILLGEMLSMDLAETFQTTGAVVIPAQHRASISSAKGGRLTDIRVKKGEMVKKGQVLGKIQDPYFVKLQQQYLEALANLKYRKAEYERKKALYEGEVGSEGNLQKAEAAYKSLQQKVNGYRSELKMLNLDPDGIKANEKIHQAIPLLSPFKGIVQQVKSHIGDYVKRDEAAFTVLERRHLRLKVMIHQKQINKVAEGQKVYAQRIDGEGAPVSGEIVGISHGLESNAQAVPAYVSLDTVPQDFKPGMVVDVQVSTATDQGLALPNGGVVRHKDHHYLFYTTNAGEDTVKFQRKTIETGPSNDQFTAITLRDALPANAQVVTHNAHYLLREMMEGTGGGHSH